MGKSKYTIFTGCLSQVLCAKRIRTTVELQPVQFSVQLKPRHYLLRQNVSRQLRLYVLEWVPRARPLRYSHPQL